MSNIINIGTSTRIKFYCAIMVMLHHYFQLYFASAGNSTEHLLPFLAIQQFGYTGVALFFFLSGYGLMESEKKHHLNLKEFLKKRFSRIYLPYLLVTVIWLPFLYILVNSISDTSPLDILYNLLWNGQDNVLWFIKILLGLYIAFYMFTYTYRRNKSIGLTVLCAITILVCIVTYHTIGFYSYISVPLFSSGILYSIYLNDRLTFTNPFIVILSVSCGIVGLSALINQNIIFMLQALANYFIILLLIMYIRRTSMTERPVKSKVFANISFDIYLVHNKVLTIFVLYFTPSLFYLGYTSCLQSSHH